MNLGKLVRGWGAAWCENNLFSLPSSNVLTYLNRIRVKTSETQFSVTAPQINTRNLLTCIKSNNNTRARFTTIIIGADGRRPWRVWWWRSLWQISWFHTCLLDRRPRPRGTQHPEPEIPGATRCRARTWVLPAAGRKAELGDVRFI